MRQIIPRFIKTHLQLLTSLLLGAAKLLQPDSLYRNETSGILRNERSNLVHRGLLHIVELRSLRAATEDLERALVDAAADGTVDGLLGSNDGLLEELTLRREVEAVVEDLGVVVGDELVTESADLTVEDETLEINVGAAEDGETGSLVASTGLEADKAVLDNVDTADTIAAGNGVSFQEELKGLGDGLALGLKLDGETLLEVNGEVLRSVRSLQRIDGEFPHIGGSLNVGVLKDTGLVRAMGKVLVHGPRLSLGLEDRKTRLSGVLKEIGTASEAVVEFRVTPRGNDLNIGLEGVERKLKANLVVTLTSAAVGDGDTSLALGDGDHRTGNDGAGEGGT